MFPAKESLPPFRPTNAAADGVWEWSSKAGAASSTDAGPRRLIVDEDKMKRADQIFTHVIIPNEMLDKMLLQQKETAMRKAVRARYAPKRADEDSHEPDF